MKLIHLELLKQRREALSKEWNAKQPFQYVFFDDFFHPQAAELILKEYPDVTRPGWSNTTYRKQQGKFEMTRFDSETLKLVFLELHSMEFIKVLEGITGIENLLPDESLFGAGLHQSVNGAFLDVHVDFNYHPETKFHRRLNILVYMNKDWKTEYNGFLELWDQSNKRRLENIAPSFNRCVIFETNERSFHGHPIPLNTPPDVSRKSISVYYYTRERQNAEVAGEHNTIFMNTQGFAGVVKTFKSGIKAFLERMSKNG